MLKESMTKKKKMTLYAPFVLSLILSSANLSNSIRATMKAKVITENIFYKPQEVSSRRLEKLNTNEWTKKFIKHFKKRVKRFGENVREDQWYMIETKLKEVPIYLTDEIKKVGGVELYSGINYKTEIHIVDKASIFHELYNSVFSFGTPLFIESFSYLFSNERYARGEGDFTLLNFKKTKIFPLETRIAYLIMKCVSLEVIIDTCLTENASILQNRLDSVLGGGTFEEMLSRDAEGALKLLVKKILNKNLPLKKWLKLYGGNKEVELFRSVFQF